MKESNT